MYLLYTFSVPVVHLFVKSSINGSFLGIGLIFHYFLFGGVYDAIARSNQGKRSIGASARRGRGGTVWAGRTFWPRREARK